MNDGNDKHEGAWWGNLETLKPSQVQSDYSYVDEDDRRKKCDRWKLVDHTARKTRATIKHVDDNTGNAEIRIQTLVAANRVDAFLDIGKSF